MKLISVQALTFFKEYWRNSEASSIPNDKLILILANSFLARSRGRVILVTRASSCRKVVKYPPSMYMNTGCLMGDSEEKEEMCYGSISTTLITEESE